MFRNSANEGKHFIFFPPTSQQNCYQHFINSSLLVVNCYQVFIGISALNPSFPPACKQDLEGRETSQSRRRSQFLGLDLLWRVGTDPRARSQGQPDAPFAGKAMLFPKNRSFWGETIAFPCFFSFLLPRQPGEPLSDAAGR